MNSVMDDNKVLTLINGDFIKLEDHSKILFEVWFLGWASPATISRCGMVYVDPKNLTYKVYWTKWLETLGDNMTLRENLNSIWIDNFPRIIDRIYDGMSDE